MPRTDIHNAADLVRVITREIPKHVVITSQISGNGQDRRWTQPLAVADLALKAQLRPEEQTDRQLMSRNVHQNRVVRAAAQGQQRARFR